MQLELWSTASMYTAHFTAYMAGVAAIYVTATMDAVSLSNRVRGEQLCPYREEHCPLRTFQKPKKYQHV